ncbi:MAG: hypothetical protein LBS20_11740 [Prevotella sp.]|nr:hypothetical protein [Prevotella sp.]
MKRHLSRPPAQDSAVNVSGGNGAPRGTCSNWKIKLWCGQSGVQSLQSFDIIARKTENAGVVWLHSGLYQGDSLDI